MKMDKFKTDSKPLRRAGNDATSMKHKRTHFLPGDQKIAGRLEEQRLNSHVKN